MQDHLSEILLSILYIALCLSAVFLISLNTQSNFSVILGLSSIIAYVVYIRTISQGFNWKDHSQGNFIILLIYLSLFFCVFLWYKLMRWSHRLDKKLLYVILGFMILMASYIGEYRFIYSCSEFDQGLLPGYSLSKVDKEECNWNESKICWHYTIYGLLKPLWWGRTSCIRNISDYQDVAKAIGVKSVEGLVVSVPKQEEMTEETWSHYSDYQKTVYKMMEEVSPSDIKNGRRELFYDFRLKNNPKLIINLKKIKNSKAFLNEKISNNNDKTKSQIPSITPSFLNIFIDTVSRQRFHRRYSQLKKYLRSHHYSKSGDYLAYEFYRSHSDRGYTSPNLLSSTYGYYDTIYDAKYQKRIENYAKEQGYVTGISTNYCGYLEVDIESGYSGTYPDKFIPHHTLSQLGCDYNLQPKENPFAFGFGKGPYSVALNCLFGKESISYIYDHVIQFFRMYKAKRKYYSLRVIDAHELSGEISNLVIDPWITKILKKLESENLIKNTIIRIHSDHGDHINPISYKTDSGTVERFNPVLLTMIPISMKERMGKYLEVNSQRLMSHRDFFVADLKMMGARNNTYNDKGGLDYYQSELPRGRDCSTIKLYYPFDLCYCL